MANRGETEVFLRGSFKERLAPPKPFGRYRVNPATLILTVGAVLHLAAAGVAYGLVGGPGPRTILTPYEVAKLAVATQLVLAIMVAVAAYRIWEAEPYGSKMALPLGGLAVAVSIVLGSFGIPVSIAVVCLAPGILDLAGGAVEVSRNR